MKTTETAQLLTDFLDACVAACRGGDPRVSLRRLVESLVTDPNACAALPDELDDRLRTPSGMDVGAETTLHESDELTVTLLDTHPGVIQPPHDHRMAAIIGVFEGAEDQRLFSRHAGGIRPVRGRRIGPGQVMTLGSQAVHAISATGATARAVHVYLGPINTVDRSLFHPDTLAETAMNMDTYYRYCRAAHTSNPESAG